MASSRIIIDTDPGIDDILAMLLAFSSAPEDVEVVLISVTHGNVEVMNCLRNVIALLSTINKEQEWRRSHQRPEGFDTLKKFTPIVAIGAEEPLADQKILADFFHGRDGLGDVHSTHPHFSPSDTWRSLFHLPSAIPAPANVLHDGEVKEAVKEHWSFVPSDISAHKEILRVLKDNPKDTITIVAIGPLTNLALAAAEDAEAFLRVKDVVVMGGAVDVPGNITPLAEFNFSADAFAAARVLALTSPHPFTTLPPTPTPDSSASHPPTSLVPYPRELSHRLNLTLLPLDVTTTHLLTRRTFHHLADNAIKGGSPLAKWTAAFLSGMFDRAEEPGGEGGLSLHDPLAVWFAIDSDSQDWRIKRDQDIRVETTGQWTRGACVSDQREKASHKRAEHGNVDFDKPSMGDPGGWLSEQRGNRLSVVVGTGCDHSFGVMLCERMFGLSR